MANRIFDSLIHEKINQFYDSYMNVSKKIFFEDKKLFHPSEYGRYREKICIELLKFFIPKKISIGDGFIITNNDKVSSQCDLIFYDNFLTPKLQTKEMKTFYTIESVAAIIEVKSILKRIDLKKALVKLANIKNLRTNIIAKNNDLKYKKSSSKFDPITNPQDNIFSVLICEKFDFNTAEMEDIINKIYPEDIPAYNRHNLILSLEDGLLMYNFSECTELAKKISKPLEKVLNLYPVFNNNNLKSSYLWSDEKKSHIKTFLYYFIRGIQGTTIIIPEIMEYITGFNRVELNINGDSFNKKSES